MPDADRHLPIATPDFRTLGHAAVLLGGPPRVVVDPWRGGGDGAGAAVALVTHGHADHCSEEDLLAATADGAPILCPAHLAPRLERSFPGRVVPLAEGATWRVDGTQVLALPSEGPPRARGFHPRGDGLSFLVTVAGARFLVLGDSDALPEHEGLAPDVAFVAVGDFTVLTPEEAADAAVRVAPALAVPVHWGDTSARHAAARRFCELCEARGIASVDVRGARDSGEDPD